MNTKVLHECYTNIDEHCQYVSGCKLEAATSNFESLLLLCISDTKSI